MSQITVGKRNLKSGCHAWPTKAEQQTYRAKDWWISNKTFKLSNRTLYNWYLYNRGYFWRPILDELKVLTKSTDDLGEGGGHWRGGGGNILCKLLKYVCTYTTTLSIILYKHSTSLSSINNFVGYAPMILNFSLTHIFWKQEHCTCLESDPIHHALHQSAQTVHLWNPTQFIMHSTGLHSTTWRSGWKLVDP